MELDNLVESLSTYEFQLAQVNEALKDSKNSTGDDQYDSLISLKNDLHELINLTKENIDKFDGGTVKQDEKECDKNDCLSTLDDEYALFMEEMKREGAHEDVERISELPIDSSKSESTNESENVEEELKALEGMKCAVLFTHRWGGEPSLYNAMVSSIVRDDTDKPLKYDDIQVRVLFTNPTQTEMIPCPYYLNGDCKFNDDGCKYSHGEVFSLLSLRTALEPDFASLKIGSNVLAKIKSENECFINRPNEKYLLWHRAIVKSIDADKNSCDIKLENNSHFKGANMNSYRVDFENIFPLTGDDNGDSDCTDDSDDNFFKPDVNPNSLVSSITSDLVINPDKMGDWEKHTKGIGSKLMIKMGYIVGTGLGPLKDGIMEPIPCRVLPTGRSLDHCMNLREKFASIDPLKAEKKLQRTQRKAEERKKKAYERAKERERHDVFNFLNATLSTKNPEDATPAKKADSLTADEIKASTCKNLNIEQFKLMEDMKRVEKDVAKLQGSISRNSRNSGLQKELSSQLNSKLNEIRELKSRENKITNEQRSRRDKKKLTIF